VNAPDAYAVPFFNRDVDQQTGYRTKSILCVPVATPEGRPFAVMTLLNKRGAPQFDARDERAACDLARSIGVVLQTWHRTHRARQAARAATA
jgi:GAF domain-containing protein